MSRPMATDVVPKPSKWFSNKSLRVSLHRRGSKSGSVLSSPGSPRSPVPPRTPKCGTREDEFREVFRYFDEDRDGKISAVELKAYFESIGEYMSDEEAQGVIADLDSDGDNLLDFQDFMRLMKRDGGGGEDQDLKKAFEMFEWEKGSGCITPKGLQRMLQRLGNNKSFDECKAMIHVYDIDGNGVLDFNEFHQMMA
jgi:calcium-binding protein CML